MLDLISNAFALPGDLTRGALAMQPGRRMTGRELLSHYGAPDNGLLGMAVEGITDPWNLLAVGGLAKSLSRLGDVSDFNRAQDALLAVGAMPESVANATLLRNEGGLIPAYRGTHNGAFGPLEYSLDPTVANFEAMAGPSHQDILSRLGGLDELGIGEAQAAHRRAREAILSLDRSLADRINYDIGEILPTNRNIVDVIRDRYDPGFARVGNPSGALIDLSSRVGPYRSQDLIFRTGAKDPVKTITHEFGHSLSAGPLGRTGDSIDWIGHLAGSGSDELSDVVQSRLHYPATEVPEEVLADAISMRLRDPSSMSQRPLTASFLDEMGIRPYGLSDVPPGAQVSRAFLDIRDQNLLDAMLGSPSLSMKIDPSRVYYPAIARSAQSTMPYLLAAMGSVAPAVGSRFASARRAWE